MREFIIFYINGEIHQVSGSDVFRPLSSYLRNKLNLTGTKVVCSEGDCGACTILESDVHQLAKGNAEYQTVNSCIRFLYQCDLKHIITVEGVSSAGKLSNVQSSMVECNGAQCGYCTPGFICSLTSLAEKRFHQKAPISSKDVKNYTTGNLCRCTGYQPIIDAGEKINLESYKALNTLYDEKAIYQNLSQYIDSPVLIKTEEKSVYIPVKESQALDALTHHTGEFENGRKISLNSGGTDLGVVENKVKVKLQDQSSNMLSLTNIQSMRAISRTNEHIEIGARATWSEIEKVLSADLPEFCRMIKIFASPQIKNVGTLVGNLANGSPIGDGIPFLMVSGAEVCLKSSSGERRVKVSDFYLGYKTFDLKENELITKVCIPLESMSRITKLYKVSVRKDLDISAVTFASSFSLEKGNIGNMKIAFGGVGPVVLRLKDVENKLNGQPFSEQNFEAVLGQVESGISPMSDHRGSKEYRTQLAKNLLMKCFHEVNQEINP